MDTKTIYSTKDYSLFSLKKVNRDVDLKTSEAKKLTRLMRQYGFNDCLPVVVRKEGGSLVVMDGQHRLSIAIKLGIKVWYAIDSTGMDISEYNESQRGWNIGNHILRWQKDGNKEYQEVVDFSRENGINLATSAGLLSGTTTPSNIKNAITGGYYEVKTRDLANSIAKCLKVIKETGQITNYGAAIKALYALHFVDYFESKELIDKIKTNPGMLVNYGDREGFLEMFSEIYNHRRRAKCPLAFDAREAMKKRNVIKS